MNLAGIVLGLILCANSFGQVRQVVIGSGMNNRIIVGSTSMKTVDANMVSLPFKYREVAEAVGLMSMGCTGTHIGNGLVVSAGHCFSDANISKQRSSCEGIQVFWGLREGKQPSSVSNCKQVLVLELNNQKDYALFRVDVGPRASAKIRTQGRPSLGTRVTIFSHPFKNPLVWSGICDISRSVSTGLNAHAIHHRCDTNPGSSGAAIIDATSLEIVGIHGGGINVGQFGGANYGTYIDFTYIPMALQRLGYR